MNGCKEKKRTQKRGIEELAQLAIHVLIRKISKSDKQKNGETADEKDTENLLDKLWYNTEVKQACGTGRKNH